MSFGKCKPSKIPLLDSMLRRKEMGERGMGKRGFEDVTGHELGQQRPKRKEEEHKTKEEVSNNKLEGAFVMDSRSEHLQDTSVSNNNLLLLIGKEGDVGIHAGAGSAGSIAEVSAIGSFSSKEYSSSEEVLSKEYNILANKAASCSELSSVILPAEKDVVLEESIVPVEFDENYNNMTNTSLKQHHISTNRGNNDMPEFTGYDSGRKLCQEASLNENFMPASGNDNSTMLKVSGCHPDKNSMLPESVSSSKDENSAVEEIKCGISARENNMNSGTASESYLMKGSAAQAIMTENDMDGTELVREHVVEDLPLVTECGNEENSNTEFPKIVCAPVANNMNHIMHEENVSERTFSLQNGLSVVGFCREPLSSISTAVNQKVLYANCKGESSLPPSPIRGLIDSCPGKPKWHNNQLDSLNAEDAAFSFQLPDKFSNASPKKKNSLEMQGALGRVTEPDDHTLNLSTERPSNIVSISADGDIVIGKEKERIPLSCSCTLEVIPLSKETKNDVRVLSSMPPERSLASRTRKKLLVLDLNGLLADIVNDYNVAYSVQKRIGGKPIFKRPFCHDFLTFCFEKFDIGIWSSRRKYNVDSAVDYLMGEFKHKLLFCWDQSKCTFTGVRTLENHHKPLVLKELKKLWNKEESDLPWEKGEFSPSNTLLLDDSPYKALYNPPYTAIFPNPYHYNDEGDNALGPGGDIRVYLEQLVLFDDVQYYVKDNPFGQPAITASNQDWEFYCQIMESQATPLS